MNKPIKLRLVEVNDGKYFLEYPNLSVPIEMNEHLFSKFLKSKDYVIEGVQNHNFLNSGARNPSYKA